MIIDHIYSEEELSLDEFCHICDEIGEFKGVDDLMKVAKPLVELANNKNLLVNFLNSELSELDKYQNNSNYNIQSLSLAKRIYYDVRMNFWPTSAEYKLENKEVRNFFAYEFAHDHNFDFITDDLFNFLFSQF